MAGVDRVVVATDDERIASVVNDFDGQVIFTNPSLPSGTDRVAEAVDKIGENFDVILNIQGDEPAMHPETIASLVELMASDSRLSMGTAACPFRSAKEIFDPNNVKVVVDDQSRALYFSRSPIPYLRSSACFDLDFRPWMAAEHLSLYLWHLGIYAYRPLVLKQITALPVHPLEESEKLEQLRALAAGVVIGVARTPHCSAGVDTPEDVRRAEKLLKNRVYRT